MYAESSRVPQIVGTGTTGAGGRIPQATAIEPPLVGNPNFTVGVSNALGGASAILIIDSNDPGTGAIPASGSFARVTVQLFGNGVGNGYGSTSLPIPNNPALVNQTFYGRWYVSDASGTNGTAISPAFRFTVFGEASAPTARAKHADFDGDGKTDVSVFRPSGGSWFISNSSNNGSTTSNFGLGTDTIAPEDYDGDGKADVAVFRSGVWYIQQSRDGFKAAQFCLGTDKPVASDYDGDGKCDIAVYRDGVWYLLQSTSGFVGVPFGTSEDKPVLGDYDGDGKSDLAVFRPSSGIWCHRRSSDTAWRGVLFGVSTDLPAPGDYDGDGKSDYAVFRALEGNWYIMQNADNAVRAQSWGTNGDVPIPAANVP